MSEMTLDEIDNAPKGSTHYCRKSKQYYKLHGYDLWRWIGKWLYLRCCDRGDIYVEVMGFCEIK